MSDGQLTLDAPTTAGTDLAVIGGPVTALTVFGTPGGVDAILAKIRAQAAAVETDISTPAGRKAVASLAYKIARSKTALDGLGKELGEDHYRAWKAITAERARVETELDALRDEVRKPLTDWEQAEKDRVAAHEAAINALRESIAFYDNGFSTAADLRQRLAFLENQPPQDWQEFAKRAADTLADEIAKTKVALAQTEALEAAVAEEQRIERERVAQEKREREARIAAQAAEQARLVAERKAAEEAAAVAEHVRREREAAEAERLAIEERARKAEEDRRVAQERAETRRIEAHDRALQSIKGMISDACSPFNYSDMIRGISKIMEAMPEMTRDWEEFADNAAAVIADGRKRIAARLAEAEKYEEEARRKREAERVAAEQRGEHQRKAAAEQAECDRLQAIEDERRRVEAERVRQEQEAARREADKKHRGEINAAARDALIAGGLSEGAATTAITLIAGKKIPGVSISY